MYWIIHMMQNTKTVDVIKLTQVQIFNVLNWSLYELNIFFDSGSLRSLFRNSNRMVAQIEMHDESFPGIHVPELRRKLYSLDTRSSTRYKNS